MQILFSVIGILIALFVLYLIGMQFYKIGKIVKIKNPILYRLYLIFWFFIGGAFLIGSLTGIYVGIENQANQTKIKKRNSEIDSVMKKGVGFDAETVKNQYEEIETYQIYLSNQDKYNLLYLKKGIIPLFDEVKSKGYTDEDIGDYYSIYGTRDKPRINYMIQAGRKIGMEDNHIFKNLKLNGFFNNEIKNGMDDNSIAQNYGLKL